MSTHTNRSALVIVVAEFDAEDLLNLAADRDPTQATQPLRRQYDGQRIPLTALEALELEQTIDDLQRLMWPDVAATALFPAR